MMPYVSFVDDERFKRIVSETLRTGRDAKNTAEKGFNRNTVDPFAMLWEMSSFGISFKEWYQREISRQAQKTLSNHVGMFHQKFLGSVNDWEDKGVGQQVDLVNKRMKIIAEVKNNHNTVTGAKLADLYRGLENLVMPNGQTYKGYTAYYVEIVPKKPERYNKPFTPSDNRISSKCHANEQIRKIDGVSFYALVTGIENALEQVFLALPEVMKDLDTEINSQEIDEANLYFQKAYYTAPS